MNNTYQSEIADVVNLGGIIVETVRALRLGQVRIHHRESPDGDVARLVDEGRRACGEGGRELPESRLDKDAHPIREWRHAMR